MQKAIASVGILCLAILHTADGIELRVRTDRIAIERPAEAEHVKQQLHHRVNTIVYVDGKPWGVVETKEQVQEAMHNCIDGGGR